MSALTIDLTFERQKAEDLFDALEEMNWSDKVEFFDGLADDFEILTLQHITKASKTRHKSAARLGANPTGYLEKIATAQEGVKGEGSPGLITLRLQGEIFKRAFSQVTVKKDGKPLTIPIAAESYGRRAKELGPMFRIKSRKGNVLLVQNDPDDKKKLKLLYVLKDQVTLPQDRGLLPSDEQFLRAAEKAAIRHVKLTIQKKLAGE